MRKFITVILLMCIATSACAETYHFQNEEANNQAMYERNNSQDRR